MSISCGDTGVSNGIRRCCCWVSGFVIEASDYYRVTVHRTLFVGQETNLQQATPDAGRPKRSGDAGRTFEFTKETIGYAATAK